MADFTKIVYGDTTYKVKDKTAREAIAALEGGSYFLGITTTPLEDQATTNPIMIEGEEKTATNGNIAVYKKAEFIFNGTKWIEFGDLSSLGALAYKGTASGTNTPEGTIAPITPEGTIDASSSTASSTNVYSITDVGTLPSVEYDSSDESLSFDPGTLPTKGAAQAVLTSVTIAATFNGTEVTPVFTGKQKTVTVS